MTKNWNRVSAQGLALVRKMLVIDPNKRPTLEDILEDPWMNDNDVINRVNEIVFADSVEKLPPSLFDRIRKNETFDEPESKRRRVIST